MSALDHAHLAQYTLGDEALTREILLLFGRQARLYIDALENTGDAQAWRDAAHSLKGSARTLGAFALAQEAERVEHMGLCAGALRDKALEPLHMALATVEREIDEMLARSTAG